MKTSWLRVIGTKYTRHQLTKCSIEGISSHRSQYPILSKWTERGMIIRSRSRRQIQSNGSSRNSRDKAISVIILIIMETIY